MLFRSYGNKNTDLYKSYLCEMNKHYTNDNSSDRIIVDFIAGMTDKFFINQYKKLYEPINYFCDR